jgi:hypothetical protein
MKCQLSKLAQQCSENWWNISLSWSYYSFLIRKQKQWNVNGWKIFETWLSNILILWQKSYKVFARDIRKVWRYIPKWVIRSRQSKDITYNGHAKMGNQTRQSKDIKYNGQKKKQNDYQWSTKYNIERLNNTYST